MKNILQRQINAGYCDTGRNQFQQLRRETLLRAFISLSLQFYITVQKNALGGPFIPPLAATF